jgi:hypothetical protein
MTFEEWYKKEFPSYWCTKMEHHYMERAWNVAQEQLLKEMYPLRQVNKESDNG